MSDLGVLAGSAYQIVYADPPWPYPKRNNPDTRYGRGTHGHYESMAIGEILQLPVQTICAEDALLFLWATFPRLEQALQVMRWWGFSYSTAGFVWMKQNPSGEGLFFGTGYYSKSNAEVCLLGTRGKVLKPHVNTVSSAVLAPRREHSKKPDEVRERIAQLYPTEKKIELFARGGKVEGWDGWGEEYGK